MEHGLKVGDKVRLSRFGYRTEDVRILKLSESDLSATRKDGAVIVVEWRDIYKLEVVKFHPVKTVAAGVGIVVLLPVLFLFAVLTDDGAMLP